jgi:ABC-2 type transport system ATP-binding protein
LIGSVDPVLECSDLVRRFGHLTAVDGVSLAVAPGETYGLLGPNGAGKTTTISMICGLLTPTAGSVRVLGRQISPSTSEGKAAIGLVPQDIALYPDLSARENLRFFGRLQGLRGHALEARIAEVLDVVGLTERATDRIETYSGGMKRRANIAVGMLHGPRLLVLDEPTVGVDPQSRHSILEAVAELGTTGMAVLYTTHYMEEAERLCDRIGIIDSGRLVAEGTSAELVARLDTAAVVALRADGAPLAKEAWRSALAALPDVVVRASAAGAELTCTDPTSAVAAAFERAGPHGVTIRGVEVTAPDLEAVFLHLTGRALRDEP